jgi:hypothetical protein
MCEGMGVKRPVVSSQSAKDIETVGKSTDKEPE